MKKYSLVLLISLALSSIILVGCNKSNDINLEESNNVKNEALNQNVDDIIFEGYEIEEDDYGYIHCKYKVKNNTNETIKFQGISIIELNENGDILDSWDSYNQNAIDVSVKPDQSISFETTHSIEEGIVQINSTKYTYEDENENWIEKEFIEPVEIYIK